MYPICYLYEAQDRDYDPIYFAQARHLGDFLDKVIRQAKNKTIVNPFPSSGILVDQYVIDELGDVISLTTFVGPEIFDDEEFEAYIKRFNHEQTFERIKVIKHIRHDVEKWLWIAEKESDSQEK